MGVLGGLEGVTVARNEIFELHPDFNLPAVNLLEGGHSRQGLTDQDGVSGEDTYRLSVGLDLYVTGDDGPAMITALNDLWGRVKVLLEVDLTLGGLVEDIREQALSEPFAVADEGKTLFMSATLEYEFIFVTGEGLAN